MIYYVLFIQNTFIVRAFISVFVPGVRSFSATTL